eukprot:391772-Prorocentrum_minimum.AAC.1
MQRSARATAPLTRAISGSGATKNATKCAASRRRAIPPSEGREGEGAEGGYSQGARPSRSSRSSRSSQCLLQSSEASLL